MKRARKFFFAGIIILCCCSPSLLLPTTKDVAAARNRWSDADSLSLRKGYTLYVNKCGACHKLYKPAKFPEEKWKKEVPLMMIRAKISEEQKELILRYILAKRETMLSANPSGKKN